jgi:hypothetical protein
MWPGWEPPRSLPGFFFAVVPDANPAVSGAGGGDLRAALSDLLEVVHKFHDGLISLFGGLLRALHEDLVHFAR